METVSFLKSKIAVRASDSGSEKLTAVAVKLDDVVGLVGVRVGVEEVGAWLFTVIDTTESAVPPAPAVSVHLTVQLAVPYQFEAGVIVKPDPAIAQSTSEVVSAVILNACPAPLLSHTPPGELDKSASQTVVPEFEFTVEQVGAVAQFG